MPFAAVHTMSMMVSEKLKVSQSVYRMNGWTNRLENYTISLLTHVSLYL